MEITWTDVEVEREWVCVELQPTPDRVLFSGVVEPSRFDELGAVFVELDVPYTMEL